MKCMMTALVLTGLSVLLMGTTKPPAQRFDWSEVQAAGRIQTGTLVPAQINGTPVTALRLENPTDQPKTFRLLTIASPPLTQFKWRLVGQIRYQNVAGQGYLELLNFFPQGQFFTRSLADQGPLQSLKGTSDWRSFVLPFDASTGGASGQGQLPQRLELNLVLPGRGVVELGPVELLDGFNSGAWWDGQEGGLVGAVLGSSVGILGAVIGVLAGLGRSRGLVLFLTQGTMVACGGLLLVGIYAFVVGQPYAVFYPLLLTGGLGLGIFGWNYKILVRRYQELELRQMRARDAAL